jgi:septal ring factor EnvC (AmiA/AmiB activator)
LRLACLAICLSAAVPATADREGDLAQLRARLEKLQSELTETRGDRDEARDRLRDTERRVGAVLRTLRQTETRAHHETTRLANLQHARRHQHAELTQHRGELARLMRASYALGSQDTLKLLLSQEDPERVSRMLTYSRYLAAARTTRIEASQRTLARLDAVETEIRERQSALAALQAQQREERQALESARAERRVALARLNAEVRSRSQQIERLKHDEARLTQLLHGLRSTLRAQPAPPGPPARTGKGQWRLPVAGRVVARYGQSRGIGALRWRGLFIAAAEGQPVRAVTGGRVVFADWLRGFGLLVVLDHGKGLMSLYGHNQGVYKSVGDSVEAGETLAVSGNTGGPPQPGLYFEVREHGEPRNPLDWCKL